MGYRSFIIIYYRHCSIELLSELFEIRYWLMAGHLIDGYCLQLLMRQRSFSCQFAYYRYFIQAGIQTIITSGTRLRVIPAFDCTNLHFSRFDSVYNHLINHLILLLLVLEGLNIPRMRNPPILLICC